jgi:pyruvate/2-oxoglutarate dehydrogenase complex dihydrolipoamide dehydrogenase (E3) component
VTGEYPEGFACYPGQQENDMVQMRPDDEHNRTLISHVHPADWVNPTPADHYNLVVIGAGTAGLVTAAGAAGLGARVALVERSLMGGDCLNSGCVPSKALIRAGKAIAAIRKSSEFGVTVHGEVEVDFAGIMERMRRLRAEISPHDSAKRFRDLGIDVFLGSGRFSGRSTVEVEGASLEFSRACVATGARAMLPPIPGLDSVGALTNETLFSLTELPQRLVVIGAGPIGCEMAQAFARFGSAVTLIDMADQVLVREDPDAAAIVQAALVRDGVNLVLGASIRECAKRDGGKVVVLERDGRAEEVMADAILVAVGRAPNVDDMGLDAAGVTVDRAGVVVDDRLRTSNRAIYAAGDVCSKYKFTHSADFLARIVIRNALFRGRANASALTIPWATYTDPEIAHVGLYERDAEERGIAIDTYRKDLAGVDRAILDGDREGFVKIHTRKGKDTIVGATIVATHAGDLISEITLAMAAGFGLGSIANVIHPYPTQAEAIRHLGDAYNRTRLTPFVQKLMSWVMVK